MGVNYLISVLTNQVKPKAKVAKIATNEGIIIVNKINKMQSK